MNLAHACGMETSESAPPIPKRLNLAIMPSLAFTVEEANVICIATGGGFFRDVRAADLVKVCQELIELRKGLMSDESMHTVEEVKAAYEKTELEPIRGAFVDVRHGKQCGCAITAIACCSFGMTPKRIEELTVDADRPVYTMANRIGLEKLYAEGFVGGFDNRPASWYPGESEAIGFTDGRAAAAAIFTEST
jgi:hypothetical protein